MTRSVRKLAGNVGGAASAEFALVVPLLAFLIFGILQYGVMMYTYNNMSNAAREAARALAVGEVDAAEAEDRAEALLVGWPDDWEVTAEGTGTTGTEFVRVEITVPGSQAGIVPYAPSPEQLRTEVFMREE